MATLSQSSPSQANISTPSHPAHLESSNLVKSPIKRKRDINDEGTLETNGHDSAAAKSIGQGAQRDESARVRDLYTVIQSFDIEPPLLKRPLSEAAPVDGPDAKRLKADEGAQSACIADKVERSDYRDISELMDDVQDVAARRTEELRVSGDDAAAIATIDRFKQQAKALQRREVSYPTAATDSVAASRREPINVTTSSTASNDVLTVFGNAPGPRYLFTSLPQSARKQDPAHSSALPTPLSTTAIVSIPSAGSKRPRTLGEIFPAPRGLLPLQPPKAPKTTTKSNVLGTYYPGFSEKSNLRSDTYASQSLASGAWLDYSSATASHQIKTRQRERAQSLAGVKPSSRELEASEVETLYRGAFSSFAPPIDNTAASITSGEAAEIWYQRVGQRVLQRLIDAEEPVPHEFEDYQKVDVVGDVDEEQIVDLIENWDESSWIDPALEDVMGKKSKEEKDIDETLQDVSDLIETLASYQRNRNLTLPTSQNRSSADPVAADMLYGMQAQEPSEEETATYQLLKDQLALIIKSLPPYAIARIDSNKFAELNISTKLEVRTDEYQGSMDSQEPVAKPKPTQDAMAAAAAMPRPAAQRTASTTMNGTYSSQSYARQYPVQNQSPVPVPNHYLQQTGSRPQLSATYPRTSSGTVPTAAAQQRPSGVQSYRPNGYSYNPSTPAARPTALAGAAMSYQGSTGQSRVNHASMPTSLSGGAGTRHPSGYGSYQPQQGSPIARPGLPANNSSYMNGNSAMSQRPSLPPASASQYLASPAPSPSRAASYGMSSQPASTATSPHRFQPSYPANTGTPTYAPVVHNQAEFQRNVERSAARSQMLATSAQQQMSGYPPSGLPNGGAPDAQKLAMARARMAAVGVSDTPAMSAAGMPPPQ